MASRSAGAAASGLSPLGKAFFGSLCAGTFGLGCWQTQRLFEKQELVKKRQHDLSLDPLPLSSSSASASEGEKDDDNLTSSLSFRRRVVRGTFQHDKEVLIGPRGPPPGAMASSGPSSGRSEGGMSSSPQGYFVITPLVVTSDDSTNESTVVFINRGWIPRHFVQQQPPQTDRRSSNDKQNRRSNVISSSWNRPEGQVQVIGIPVKPEQPRIITPQHDFSKVPPRLFYVDEMALQRNLASGSSSSVSTDYAIVGPSSSSSSSSLDKATASRPIILQQVRTDDDDDDDQTASDQRRSKDASASSSSSALSFPVQPPLSSVGEYKVTPMIHAGYALTWYGLAGAGLFMTRKLITRGR